MRTYVSSAAVTVRDKLESLCRELQRQNKLLMVISWLVQIIIFFNLYFIIDYWPEFWINMISIHISRTSSAASLLLDIL